MPSRHRRDSCLSHNEVGGFFFDFERHGAGVGETPSTRLVYPRRQDGEIGVVRAGGTSLDIRRAELAPDLELRQTPAPHAHWMEREIVSLRRPVAFPRSYAIDATRLHLTMMWVVSISILSGASIYHTHRSSSRRRSRGRWPTVADWAKIEFFWEGWIGGERRWTTSSIYC